VHASTSVPFQSLPAGVGSWLLLSFDFDGPVILVSRLSARLRAQCTTVHRNRDRELPPARGVCLAHPRRPVWRPSVPNTADRNLRVAYSDPLGWASWKKTNGQVRALRSAYYAVVSRESLGESIIDATMARLKFNSALLRRIKIKSDRQMP
jgi:hypothetical protein